MFSVIVAIAFQNYYHNLKKVLRGTSLYLKNRYQSYELLTIRRQKRMACVCVLFLERNVKQTVVSRQFQ